MEVIVERCAGLDVHARMVKVAVRSPGEGRVRRRQQVREFATFYDDMLAMADWLIAEGVTEVAMEATGVFWRSPWQALEERAPWMVLRLVNAAHVKMVPGRKTDVNDAAWLAQLLECGLLRGSFVPDRQIGELRDLNRFRKKLVAERARESQRVRKVLDDAGVKLGEVASNPLGVSGRQMIEALIAGEADFDAMADMAIGKLRSKIPELRRALDGRFRPHHAFMLRLHLDRIDQLGADIARIDEREMTLMAPFDERIARLTTIPGVGPTVAWTIIAETGGDMARFPTAGHLASWAGMCPGHHESAGKSTSGKPRKGNPHLRAAMCEAAWAAKGSKDTYLAAQFARMRRGRNGDKRAIMAVGHSILVAAWHILANDHDPGEPDVTYIDLGPDWFTKRLDPAQTTKRLVDQLHGLGYKVTLTPAA